MKSTTFRNDILKLEFQGVAIASVADNAVTSPLTSLFAALHSAFPGYAGTQATSEAAYTGYARKPIARSVAGFTVTGNLVTLAANVVFDERTDNGAAVELPFFTIGRLVTGAGVIHRIGVLGSKMGVITATAADAVTVPGHTLVINDRCTIIAVDGQALPAGTTEGALYFVKTVAGNDITLSTTLGGATLDITAAGTGMLFRSTPISVTQGVSPVIKSTSTITEN